MKRVLIIFLLFSLCFTGFGQDLSKQKNQKKKIEEEIAFIDKQISITKSKQKENFNTLALTQKKIEARKDLIAEIDLEIKGYDKALRNKNAQIEKLQLRLDTLKLYYERLILNSYKNRDSKMWFMYIMASDNFSQGIRRWAYLKNLSASIKAQANDIKSTELDLALEKENLLTLKNSSIRTQKEREQEYYQLSQEETQVMNTINSLKKQEKDFRADLQKKKKEVEKLNKEIERILSDAVKQQKKAGSKVVIDYELSAKFSDNKGKLPWPVKQGVVVEKFGQGYHPVFRTVKLPFNNGVNISTTAGSDAYCVFDGVVKQILIMPGYNQCILVQHGEYFTFYCKLKRVYVKTGQKLKTGEDIGSIDTNEEGNAILHFQLWKGTEKQNPEYWLRK